MLMDLARRPFTVSAEVAATLAEHVTDVFGLMGNGNAYLLDALLDPAVGAGRVAYTAVRHEAGAVVAADAYYRACGRIAAATTTYGAGFTNTITALAESAQAGIPLLLVVGDAPEAGPRPWDVDQRALASALGVRTFTVGHDDAAATTARALEHALRGRTPAVLAIPYNLAARAVPARAVSALPGSALPGSALPGSALPGPAELALPGPAAPDEAAIDDAAQALATSRRPLLLAGRGAWLAGAGEALGRLARLTGAVTASSALGRGVFPDARFDLGVAGGFGQPDAMELIRQADIAVVFGASLNQFTTRFGELFSPGTRVIQVDTAQASANPAVTDFICGDALRVAEGIADRLSALGLPASGWRESVDFAPLRVREPGEDRAEDGRLDPRAVAARIGELLPEDRVVVSDGGHFIGWANMYWPVASPDRMMMVGTAYQAIGLGMASVAGAAAARPDSAIVLTTGDGGGLMAIADLDTAVRTAGGRGLAVVWNDAAYGAEMNLYGLKGLAQEPMLIREVDFAAVARGFGAEGVVVSDLADLDALAEWASRPVEDRPFLLLDCRVSPAVIAPYQREIIRVNS